jgi:phospholipid/cholesterol/gamma-HCH transport system permease protein
MPEPTWTQLDAGPTGAVLRLQGAWRLTDLPAIETALRAADWSSVVEVDGRALQQLDSAAALVLVRTARAQCADAGTLRWTSFDGPAGRILDQVQQHLQQAAPVTPARGEGLLARIGRLTLGVGQLMLGHMNFLGQTVVAVGDLLTRRRRLRWREFSAQVQQTGLDAIPVVALVTMLIGVVFTYLLGLQASKYGANIFVVDGVAVGSTREFAPILVAIVVAGRSGAAFTAQLGSMRLTEEIDAIQTLGLSPQQVLVLPRVLALMLTLPLLVFVGDLMSIVGSNLIAGPMLGISVPAYMDRLREALELKHVLIGLAKAPVFAAVIAVIGTRMGMTVGRDTRAVGAATTSTVVQSIVAVILLDAVFAILLQALGW